MPRYIVSVVPTHVGMARVESIRPDVVERSPHARGDGPLVNKDYSAQVAVVPTHVGMAR